jgi:hypothetical protein
MENATKPRRDRRGYLQPSRRNKSKINAWFTSEVHSAIREIAARENVRLHDVVTEAFRDVLIKRGVKPPPELVPK